MDLLVLACDITVFKFFERKKNYSLIREETSTVSKSVTAPETIKLCSEEVEQIDSENGKKMYKLSFLTAKIVLKSMFIFLLFPVLLKLVLKLFHSATRKFRGDSCPSRGGFEFFKIHFLKDYKGFVYFCVMIYSTLKTWAALGWTLCGDHLEWCPRGPKE